MIPNIVAIILLLFALRSSYSETFIRINQVGFLPSETKTAVILSTEPLDSLTFSVVNEIDSSKFISELNLLESHYYDFEYVYAAEFSDLTTRGTYRLMINDVSSSSFSISDNLYHSLSDSLLGFYKFQRCGSSRAPNFKPCHLHDATKIIGLNRTLKAYDLTGGWHDAGDYVKFLNTTAITVYYMLLAAQRYTGYGDTVSLLKSRNILAEAKIGLDWLMKLHPDKKRLIIQVQDIRDQDVGWRLPEEDPKVFNRPAFELPSKSHCGLFSAAFALAADVYKKSEDTKYANICLKHARQVYRLAFQRIPNTASNADSIYYDNSVWDNLALASIELYRTTGKNKFLKKYLSQIKNAPMVNWVSWGDVGGFAFARGIPYSDDCAILLREMLENFLKQSRKSPFGFPLPQYTWGSASVQAGVASLSLMYYQDTGESVFLDLAEQQRDFLLGKNSHGVCLISGFGSNFTKNFHHQISYLSDLPLTGGFASGMVSAKIFESREITLTAFDRFSRFQSKKAVYHDDRNDYLCNEPTIANNALALFLFAFFDQHYDLEKQ